MLNYCNTEIDKEMEQTLLLNQLQQYQHANILNCATTGQRLRDSSFTINTVQRC